MLSTMQAYEEAFIFDFDVSVTVHHWYNNVNSQLDATITNFIDNYNQLNMFRATISTEHVQLIVIINKICYCCI